MLPLAGFCVFYITYSVQIKIVSSQAVQLGIHYQESLWSPRDLLKDTLLTRYKERKPITWRDLNPSTHVHEVGILPLATIVSKWLKFAFGTKNWAVNVTKSFCLKKLEIIFSRSMFLLFKLIKICSGREKNFLLVAQKRSAKYFFVAVVAVQVVENGLSIWVTWIRIPVNHPLPP